VAYPDLVNGGQCPKGFEKRIPSLFFETIWNTYAFKDMPGTFMFANGDPTGYGYHGDFLMGWSTDILKSAIGQCTDPSGLLSACPVFELQTEADGDKCKLNMPEVLAQDNCAGPADGLCGNVPVQHGPEYATGLLKPGDSQTPTAAPTTIASSNIVAVPTLSYTTAKSAITDEFGGGISVAQQAAEESPLPVDVTGVIPTPTPAAPPVSSSTAFEAAAPSPPEVPAPAPTQSPAQSSPPIELQPQGNVISTSVYTSAGTVYHIAIEQVEVTVTVPASGPEPTPAQMHRRHVYHKHRRDREHGILGRHF